MEEVEITTVPSNVTVLEGESALLNCSANLGPPHRLVWSMKPNKEVIPDDRVEILPSGPLVFNTVRKTDEGYYQCSVKLNDTNNNSKSKNTHWAYLKVHGNCWVILLIMLHDITEVHSVINVLCCI